ncbi:hypothetical protein ACOME3_008856 [Neoechinorhynchus agilis]
MSANVRSGTADALPQCSVAHSTEIRAGSEALIRQDFFNRLASFHRLDQLPTPHISNKRIDLYELSRAVKACGGPERVSDRNLWAGMADQYGLNSDLVNGSEAIKSVYYSYLYSFDKMNSPVYVSKPFELLPEKSNDASKLQEGNMFTGGFNGGSRNSRVLLDVQSPAMFIRKQQQMHLASKMISASSPCQSNQSSLMHVPPSSYKSAAAAVAVSEATSDNGIDKIISSSILALQSGYPNELVHCLNELIRIACEVSFTPPVIPRCMTLIDLMLAHIGFPPAHLKERALSHNLISAS